MHKALCVRTVHNKTLYSTPYFLYSLQHGCKQTKVKGKEKTPISSGEKLFPETTSIAGLGHALTLCFLDDFSR